MFTPVEGRWRTVRADGGCRGGKLTPSIPAPGRRQLDDGLLFELQSPASWRPSPPGRGQGEGEGRYRLQRRSRSIYVMRTTMRGCRLKGLPHPGPLPGGEGVVGCADIRNNRRWQPKSPTAQMPRAGSSLTGTAKNVESVFHTVGAGICIPGSDVLPCTQA